MPRCSLFRELSSLHWMNSLMHADPESLNRRHIQGLIAWDGPALLKVSLPIQGRHGSESRTMVDGNTSRISTRLCAPTFGMGSQVPNSLSLAFNFCFFQIYNAMLSSNSPIGVNNMLCMASF